mmetsp:Transcript_36406/g.74233  ORF Transcript_36406/g.74233 Transcript_36406/m.74233 type:complete len:136 (-) Transcript_36406:2546-2953(-)
MVQTYKVFSRRLKDICISKQAIVVCCSGGGLCGCASSSYFTLFEEYFETTNTGWIDPRKRNDDFFTITSTHTRSSSSKPPVQIKLLHPTHTNYISTTIFDRCLGATCPVPSSNETVQTMCGNCKLEEGTEAQYYC